MTAFMSSLCRLHLTVTSMMHLNIPVLTCECVCGESDTLRDARTYIELHLLLHGGGHHDDTDGGDQQEVEGIHDAGACGLFDLRAAAAAAGAGRGAAAAGQLHGEKREGP